MEDPNILCLCPQGRATSACFHSQFLKEYGNERFPNDDSMSGEYRFLCFPTLNQI